MRHAWIGLLLLLTACGPSVHTLTVSVDPINSYRAYGEYHPVAEDEAVVKKAGAVAVPSDQKFHLFQEALPPGIEMNGALLGVNAKYKHKLLGKYAYSTGKAESKDALVLAVKKMCVATGANGAIILFQFVPNDHPDQAQAIEAVLAKFDESQLSQ